MWNLAVIILCIAIITSIITHLFSREKIKTVTNNSNLDQTIFICCISYCDVKWIELANSVFANAVNPNRVFIGVLEYVKESSQSMATYLPSSLRNSVRIHTISSKMATNLHSSRKTCFEKLFEGETYSLFTRSCKLKQGWDNHLIQQLRSYNNAIISFKLPENNNVLFPTIKKIKNNQVYYTYKKLKPFLSNKAVPAILSCSDFYFIDSNVNSYITSDDTELGVSSLLHSKGYKILVTSQCIAIRDQHPYGVRNGTKCSVDSVLIKDYCNHIDINLETGKVSATSKLGLVKNYDSNECILKYGSLSETRVLLQIEGYTEIKE